ncbi:MAG: hypothetical protein ABR606_21190 [Vicinamibacterales bacterium]
MRSPTARAAGLLAAVLVCTTSLATRAYAQEPKSATGARELAQLMQAKKLDSIAARRPSGDDQFVAALHFPGQLLVVWARYAAPALLNEKITKGQYRDAYIDLNSAAVPSTKVLINDLGADGLRPRRENNQPFDQQDAGGKGISFDGNWREDKMSEQDYMKIYSAADQGYAEALEALIAQLKKPN